MKKNNIRDYAVAAFRYYALTEKNKKSIVLPENNRLASGCILDLLAVKKTLEMLENSKNGIEKISALKTVYFTMPDRGFKKGEITDRIIKAATTLHISEPTVYRFLNCAETIFAENRGLRISLF